MCPASDASGVEGAREFLFWKSNTCVRCKDGVRPASMHATEDTASVDLSLEWRGLPWSRKSGWDVALPLLRRRRVNIYNAHLHLVK